MFVVVWTQQSYVNEPGIGPVPRSKVAAALLDQDGNRLQADLALTEGGSSYDVAFGAGVAMTLFSKDDGLYVRSIDEAGSLGDVQKVLEGNLVGSLPLISWAGDAFVVTYLQEGTLYGRAVDLSGKPRSGPFPIATSVSQGVDVTWIGSALLAVWVQSESNGDIYGRRLQSDGTLLDSQPLAIATGPEMQKNPSIAFNGQDTLVAWTGERGVIATALRKMDGSITPRADSGGAKISQVAQDQTSPSITHDGRRIAVLWNEAPGVRFSFPTASVEERRETVVPLSPVLRFSAPLLSSNGRQSIAVGVLNADGKISIVASRIDEVGTVLDPVPLMIGSGAALRGVLWNGSEYLVSWVGGDSNAGLRVARITSDGQVLDPGGLLINSEISRAIVRWNGSHYLATGIQNSRILSVRFSRSGELLDSAPLSVAPLDHRGYEHFDVVADGTNYFITWFSQPVFDQPTQLWGVTMRSDGTLEERKLLVSDGERKRSLHVAENSSGFELLWLEESLKDVDLTKPPTLHFARVSPHGEVSDRRSMELHPPTSKFSRVYDISTLSLPNRGFLALTYARDRGNAIEGEASRVFVRTFLASRKRVARR